MIIISMIIGDVDNVEEVFRNSYGVKMITGVKIV